LTMVIGRDGRRKRQRPQKNVLCMVATMGGGLLFTGYTSPNGLT